MMENKNFNELICFKNKYKKYERKDLIIIIKSTLKTIEIGRASGRERV